MKDIETARSVLIDFIVAMNQWELVAADKIASEIYVQEEIDKLKLELDNIFNQFCTLKERKYGRQNGISAGSPPEYDPSEEILEEELIKNKAIFVTQQHTRFKSKYRYTLHWKKDGWRVDKKELWFDDKWDKDTL